MDAIAVTGANGFVGRALVARLASEPLEVKPLVRKTTATGQLAVGDIDSQTDWVSILRGVDVVIHVAGRAHVLKDSERDPLAVFRRVNVDGTRRLAEESARAGVRRLIFLSSIGVHGNTTDHRTPFHIRDTPNPVEDYSISKWEAEQALHGLARQTGLETVIIRPPLVYGPGAPGNFRRLLRIVAKGYPLPFGAVHNSRSFVGVANLVDVILRCLNHPDAGGHTFLVSDGEDVSTPDLIRLIATGMGRQPRLIPVPLGTLRMGARLAGRARELERLIGSLKVDISDTRARLGWSPPISLADGIRNTVAAEELC